MSTGGKKHVQVSGAENTEARQHERRTGVYVKGKHKVKSKQVNMKKISVGVSGAENAGET